MKFKKIAVVGLGIFLWAAQAIASQWDEQITQWQKESTNLKADQIPQLEEAAKNGDVRATYLLYLETDNVRFEYSKRSSANQLGQWSQRIADSGNPIGMRMLCSLFDEGSGGLVKDEVKAFQWCQKGALEGFANAMMRLAYMYSEGKGVAKDEAEAVRWYRKGADLNHGESFGHLGYMYETGTGIAKNEAQAAVFYKRATDAGIAWANSYLGAMYRHGRGVAKDEAQAVSLFRKAADGNDAYGIDNLGVMLRDGIGVPKNDVEAVKWFRKGAELNHGESIGNLGYMYETGKGLAKDEAQAVILYLKAADAGVGWAMRNLGIFYKNGRGVVKNDVEAVKWFQKGADINHPGSIVHLANMYSYGRGVEKDDAKAFELFSKAAEMKFELGMSSLGWAYHAGRGVSKDINLAMQWYQKAADLGSVYALEQISKIKEHGSQDQASFNIPIYLSLPFVGSVQLGSFDIGKALTSETVKKDPDEAIRLLYKAYELATGEKKEELRQKLGLVVESRPTVDSLLAQKVTTIFKSPPKLAWVDAPSKTEEANVTFKVKVTDDGGGIGDIVFKQNGIAFDASTGRNASVIEIPKTASGELTRSFTLTLPAGKHEIEVQAFSTDNAVKSTIIKTTLVSTFKPVRRPQMYAVVVGVNDYENSTLALKYAKNDAVEVAKLLEANAGGLFEKVNITLLNTKASTNKASIVSAIEAVAAKVQNEDVFVFYAAAHGENFADGGYHLLTADVNLLLDEQMKKNSLSAAELQKLIYKISTTKKVVLLDTCQSGGGIKAGDLVQARGLDNLETVRRFNKKSGAMVLSAAESKQDALEGYQGHGLFTYALLEALSGKADTNGDKFISTIELEGYVVARADELAEKVFKRKQSPYPSREGHFEVVGLK